MAITVSWAIIGDCPQAQPQPDAAARRGNIHSLHGRLLQLFVFDWFWGLTGLAIMGMVMDSFNHSSGPKYQL